MSTDRPIRVRFAPSPTGYLHVGGARTALFNYLFAKKHGGAFILRIEDTDVLRNIEGAEAKLIEDLRWLGLTYDEGPDVSGAFGPYRQSQRRELYDAAVKKLLADGNAYYAFETPEELAAMRKEAEAQGRSFKYRRPDSPATSLDRSRVVDDKHPIVVRFKIPDESITVHDEILGDVTFAAGELEDLVIVKSNGWPTYHFAVVVDDEAMRISHVLRAQEHLMNTPKHVFIQRALGYVTPKFAHLPLVFNLDGTKMSKRDKHKAVRAAVKDCLKQKTWTKEQAAEIASVSSAAIGKWLDKVDAELDAAQLSALGAAAAVAIPEIDVHDFRAAGYLPEALLNFVALIGWSPGDDREKLSLQDMIDAFGLDRINKTAGRFDRDKLSAMNTDYAAEAAPKRLLEAFKDWAALAGSPMRTLDDATLAKTIEACRGMRTLADIEAKTGVLFTPDEAVSYDPQAVKKVLDDKDGRGRSMLRAILPRLESLDAWTPETIERLIDAFCVEQGAKLGDVAQPIRVAVAGRTISPAIGQTLCLLGKERTLIRIRRSLSKQS